MFALQNELTVNTKFHNENIGDLMNRVLKSITLLNKEIEGCFSMSSARILSLKTLIDAYESFKSKL